MRLEEIVKRPTMRARNRRELAHGRRVAPTPELVPIDRVLGPERCVLCREEAADDITGLDDKGVCLTCRALARVRL